MAKLQRITEGRGGYDRGTGGPTEDELLLLDCGGCSNLYIWLNCMKNWGNDWWTVSMSISWL
jgi:hypothetical protein